MSRFHSYLSSAAKLIHSYSKGTPLPYHLKNFFGKEKKYGSRDRKTIATLCYHYFRTAKLFNATTMDEQLVHAFFLCETSASDLLETLGPQLNINVSLPAIGKLASLGLSPTGIFPFHEELGKDIDKEKFCLSLLRKPAVFIRARPGRKDMVMVKLKEAAVSFEPIGNDGIKVPNDIALDKMFRVNKDIVVQDRNSQHVFDFFEKNKENTEAGRLLNVWDCCAASGGKSILLYDVLHKKIKLTVSDLRENILSNLQVRLQQAGIPVYKNFTADLSIKTAIDPSEKFDIIILDAPCTGSGTWARTPEQLFSFSKDKINDYAMKQQQIINNITPHLEKNGLLFYITCSVFKKENEENAEYIKEKFQLQLLQVEFLKGYEEDADSMFVAVFRK